MRVHCMLDIGLCVFNVCHVSECACSTCVTCRIVRVKRVSRIGIVRLSVCSCMSWQCDIAETELLLFLLIASV